MIRARYNMANAQSGPCIQSVSGNLSQYNCNSCAECEVLLFSLCMIAEFHPIGEQMRQPFADAFISLAHAGDLLVEG